MRIITGSLKGRVLKSKLPHGIRPSTDMARETLFNILENYIVIEDKSVIDLFSGSGIVGIEMISRGAKFVQFVDKSLSSVKYIETNLRNLEVSREKYQINKSDAFLFFRQSRQKVDLIFSDAPYNDKSASKLLSHIETNDVIKEGGLVIIEVSKYEIPIIDESRFEILKIKEFGLSKMLFLRKIV